MPSSVINFPGGNSSHCGVHLTRGRNHDRARPPTLLKLAVDRLYLRQGFVIGEFLSPCFPLAHWSDGLSRIDS